MKFISNKRKVPESGLTWHEATKTRVWEYRPPPFPSCFLPLTCNASAISSFCSCLEEEACINKDSHEAKFGHHGSLHYRRAVLNISQEYCTLTFHFLSPQTDYPYEFKYPPMPSQYPSFAGKWLTWEAPWISPLRFCFEGIASHAFRIQPKRRREEENLLPKRQDLWQNNKDKNEIITHW